MEEKRSKVQKHLEKVENIRKQKETKEKDVLEKQKGKIEQKLETAAAKRGQLIEQIKQTAHQSTQLKKSPSASEVAAAPSDNTQ